MARLNPYQLVESFPEECTEYIPKILSVLKSKILEYREISQKIESLPISQADKNLSIMILDYLYPSKERIDIYEKTLKILSKEKKLDKLTEVDIGRAKQVQIQKLFNIQKPKETLTRILCCCPIHNDQKPSFVIYKETNTYHCFSCKIGGDSIRLYMDLNKVKFSQAVNSLLRII